MTDNEWNHALDTDILIGDMLHQTEAVVEVDEQSLTQRKHKLLNWMAASTPSVPGAAENPYRPDPVSQQGDRDQRPLSAVIFLTVAEVAAVMRVSKMTVYRLVHSGHLPAIRVGRSFRVPEQAVHEYLRESSMEHIESTE